MNTMWWKKSSPAISKEAMVYGRMPEEDSRVLLYSFAEERRGYKIIEYEIYRYQVRHGIYADGQTSLRDIAFYNIVDMAMVGQYQGPDGTAALAVVAPIWNIIYSLGLLMGIGGSVIFSTSGQTGAQR